MKYAIEIVSRALIGKPSYIKICSGIQKLIDGNGEDSQTHREHGDRISLLSLFQNRESRLKKLTNDSKRRRE
jgi:hypothetical protein